MIKKTAILLLCFLLLCTGTISALAESVGGETASAVISLKVPESHTLTVEAEGARVFFEGRSADQFTLGRLSEPRLLIRAESGRVIRSITVNGVDMTDFLHGGYLTLPPVYEEKLLQVTTAPEGAAPERAYTVKGIVTLNGKPLAGTLLELRSTLKTALTDENGRFTFTDVEEGFHSLTALKEDTVIGYLPFTLQGDARSDFVLWEDGSYHIQIAKDSIGAELRLVLHEEEGTLAPTDVATLVKAGSDSPEMGDSASPLLWLLLLVASVLAAWTVNRFRSRKI